MQFINGKDNVLSLYSNSDDPSVLCLGKANNPKDVISHFPTKALGELLRDEAKTISTKNRVTISLNDGALNVTCGSGMKDSFPLHKLHIS